ncbi:unnamed protein product [Vitrella brassicaformis CCMP3155]|uniref:Uncharacterized protein n=1 Tax=Vitrella brassicaformis (strain CCMP3155) TaxID=1169540 RepID=A0A0G4ESS2_VITBC|nr:unnamed protein product [Vitrella brassicaformis CCMP3155]|eukprot:CEM01379.1 unnamed protein product [Vitrella brassicaformis CCMP3155]
MAKRHCPRQEKDVDGMLADGDDADASQQGGQQSSASLPLWVVPPDTLSTILLPLLATQCVVGTLSLVRKAFHAIAADPSNHHTVFIRSHKPIHLTHTQLRVWPPRLSQTKRAVLICPVTESVASLIEGMRRTLAYLHLDEPVSQLQRTHRLLSMRQVTSMLVFSALEEVRVGGEWVQAARRKRWALRWLVSLSIRDSPLSGRRADLVWWWRSHSSRLRSFEFDDGGRGGGHSLHELLVTTTFVRDLRALKVLRLTTSGSSFPEVDDTDLLAEHGLRLEEIDIAIVGTDHSDKFVETDLLRKSCLAPGAIERWDRSDFCFDTHFLFGGETTSAEELSRRADSIKLLASVATKVHLTAYLGDAARVPYPALYAIVPSLVFSRAEHLCLDCDFLPEMVLSNVAHMFPCVRRVEAMVGYFADELRQRVLGQLPALEALVDSVSERDEDGEFLMRVDQIEKDRPIVERIHHITAHTQLHYEQGDTSDFFRTCRELAHSCARAVHFLPRLERIVVGMRVGGEGWEGQEDIVATLQENRTFRPDTDDFTQVAFHRLLRFYGFEMVELPRLAFDCRVEMRRLGLCIPSQKRITDYFSARQRVR